MKPISIPAASTPSHQLNELRSGNHVAIPRLSHFVKSPLQRFHLLPSEAKAVRLAAQTALRSSGSVQKRACEGYFQLIRKYDEVPDHAMEDPIAGLGRLAVVESASALPASTPQLMINAVLQVLGQVDTQESAVYRAGHAAVARLNHVDPQGDPTRLLVAWGANILLGQTQGGALEQAAVQANEVAWQRFVARRDAPISAYPGEGHGIVLGALPLAYELNDTLVSVTLPDHADKLVLADDRFTTERTAALYAGLNHLINPTLEGNIWARYANTAEIDDAIVSLPSRNGRFSIDVPRTAFANQALALPGAEIRVVSPGTSPITRKALSGAVANSLVELSPMRRNAAERSALPLEWWPHFRAIDPAGPVLDLVDRLGTYLGARPDEPVRMEQVQHRHTADSGEAFHINIKGHRFVLIVHPNELIVLDTPDGGCFVYGSDGWLAFFQETARAPIAYWPDRVAQLPRVPILNATFTTLLQSGRMRDRMRFGVPHVLHGLFRRSR